MSILKELVESEDKIDALPLLEALEESVKTLRMQKKGGRVSQGLKNAQDFFKANPALTVGAAALAIGGLSAYQKNKRNTIHLHAKTAYEKKMMTSIVDALQKDGLFKIERIKFEGGGKTWVMKRKWMS